MKRLLAILFLLGLAACTQPVSPERLSGIRTIGVIAAAGGEFHFTTVGVTVFGNDYKAANIESWGLDDFLVAQATEALRQRYDVRPVTYRRAAFNLRNMDIPLGWQGPFDRRRTIDDVIRAEVQPQGLDAYVVIVDHGSPYGATNQGVRGMGLAKGGLFTQRVGLHALYRVVVVNGKDQKVIGQAFARPLGSGDSSVPLDGPSREVGTALWSEGLPSMPEAKQEQVRAGLRDLISRSMPRALREAGLVQ